MAWLEQKKSGTFHIVFRVGEEKYRRSLKTRLHKEALGRKLRVEENLKLIESGRLSVPDDADLVSFLLSDGKLNKEVSGQKRVQLGKLYETYADSLPEDSIEPNTLATTSIHLRHIARILGHHLQLRTLTTTDLQRYVNQRSKEPGLFGRTLSSGTIKKEIATLRSIWNWSKLHGYTSVDFSMKGLIFPKQQERPPFRTREEIERQIAENNLSQHEQNEIWECLHLRVPEIKSILNAIEQHPRYPHV